MCNENNTNKGFTLIELLIVIAIIGVLAATVVISLGNQTGNAKDAAVKSGVSSLRASAITSANVDGDTGSAICQAIHDQVSADKSGWTWQGATMCARNTLVDGNGLVANTEGDLCCYADGSAWAVWGGVSSADGFGSNVTGAAAANPTVPEVDVYCADSSGFLGEVELGASTTASPDLADTDLTKCYTP